MMHIVCQLLTQRFSLWDWSLCEVVASDFPGDGRSLVRETELIITMENPFKIK
jgi:hypothetical protein